MRGLKWLGLTSVGVMLVTPGVGAGQVVTAADLVGTYWYGYTYGPTADPDSISKPVIPTKAVMMEQALTLHANGTWTKQVKKNGEELTPLNEYDVREGRWQLVPNSDSVAWGGTGYRFRWKATRRDGQLFLGSFVPDSIEQKSCSHRSAYLYQRIDSSKPTPVFTSPTVRQADWVGTWLLNRYDTLPPIAGYKGDTLTLRADSTWELVEAGTRGEGQWSMVKRSGYWSVIPGDSRRNWLWRWIEEGPGWSVMPVKLMEADRFAMCFGSAVFSYHRIKP